MRGLADIADRYGSGTIRLTVWQNLLISDIPDRARRRREARDRGSSASHWSATSVRGGLVACTGNAGCKFAAAEHQAARACRSPTTSKPRLRARSADQHPPHRLPPLVRPALHRRHRPARDQGRRRRRHGRGLPRLRRRRLRRAAGHRPRDLSATCSPTTRRPSIERMLRGYLAERAVAAGDVPRVRPPVLDRRRLTRAVRRRRSDAMTTTLHRCR